jgi:hypothetical protein
MFSSLYRIGKYESEKQGKKPEQIILEGNLLGIEKTIEIQIEEHPSGFSIRVVIGNIDRKNLQKYGAYGSNKNGANIVCYEFVEGKNAHSRFKKETHTYIVKAFRTSFVKAVIGNRIIGILDHNSEYVERELNQLQLDKTCTYLMTFSYNGLYPFEFHEFRDFVKEASRQKNGFSKESMAYREHGNCTICREHNKLIVGLLYLDETFMFFNYGCSTNSRGFSISNAYKDTSICDECAEYINLGSRIVVQRTRARVSWMKDIERIVIPRLLNNGNNTAVGIFDHVTADYLEQIKKNPNPNDNTIGILEDTIAEQNDLVSFDFIYFSPAQRKINIVKYIKEVLPSRLSYLIDVAGQVRTMYCAREKYESLMFLPLRALRILLSLDGVKPEDIGKPKVTQSKTWFSDYFAILEALYTAHQITDMSFLRLLNKYMVTFVEHYDKHQWHRDKFNTGLNLYLYLLKTGTIIKKEKIMDFTKIKEQFSSSHGLRTIRSTENTQQNDSEFVETYAENVSNQFFQYWMDFSAIYQDNDYCFAFCMGYIANLVRYYRRGKGNFVDDWLANITTNINKLPYLMTRSIESLSIERCLDKASVKIPLSLAAYFKDQETNKDEITTGYDLIFPFVSGFMFRTSYDDSSQDNTEQVSQQPDLSEDVE